MWNFTVEVVIMMFSSKHVVCLAKLRENVRKLENWKLQREDFLEFCKQVMFFEQTFIIVTFSGQLSGHNCSSDLILAF